MKYEEMVQRLSKKYPRDMGPDDMTDLLKWLRRNVDESRMDDLYDSIVEKYENKTFPSIKFISGCLSDVPAGETSDFVINYCRKVELLKLNWKSLGLKEILIKCRDILKDMSGANMYDREFVHYWDKLYAEFGFLRDDNIPSADMRRHLEYVRECIINGKDFISARMSRPAPAERIEKTVSIKSAIEEYL